MSVTASRSFLPRLSVSIDIPSHNESVLPRSPSRLCESPSSISSLPSLQSKRLSHGHESSPTATPSPSALHSVSSTKDLNRRVFDFARPSNSCSAPLPRRLSQTKRPAPLPLPPSPSVVLKSVAAMRCEQQQQQTVVHEQSSPLPALSSTPQSFSLPSAGPRWKTLAEIHPDTPSSSSSSSSKLKMCLPSPPLATSSLSSHGAELLNPPFAMSPENDHSFPRDSSVCPLPSFS